MWSGTPGSRRRLRRTASASANPSSPTPRNTADQAGSNGRGVAAGGTCCPTDSNSRTRLASADRAISASVSSARISRFARSALRTCRRRLQFRPFRRLTSVSSSPSRAVATIEIVPVRGSRNPEIVHGSLQTESPYERPASSGTTNDPCSSNDRSAVPLDRGGAGPNGVGRDRPALDHRRPRRHDEHVERAAFDQVLLGSRDRHVALDPRRLAGEVVGPVEVEVRAAVRPRDRSARERRPDEHRDADPPSPAHAAPPPLRVRSTEQTRRRRAGFPGTIRPPQG